MPGILSDDPQTIELFRSMRALVSALRSVPADLRDRLLGVLASSSDDAGNILVTMTSVLEDPRSTSTERRAALTQISEALNLSHDEGNRALESRSAVAELDCPVSQQSAFAQRLREVMAIKGVTQQELSERMGCTQPAISQLLSRKRRPQKKTILSLASALHVGPGALWPDIEVLEMLDSTESFQAEDHVMTEAEARALSDTAKRNKSKIPAITLPVRQRRQDNE